MRVLGGLFFSRVRFPSEVIEAAQAAHRQGVLVYVLRSESLLDYLFFNWAFLRRGLPLAVFGQGMPMWPWRTLGAAVRSLLRRVSRIPDDATYVRAALESGTPVLLFLDDARRLFQRDKSTLLDVVHEVSQRVPVRTVPLGIAWERAPHAMRRSFIDLLFGDYERPGRLRKLLNFVGSNQAYVFSGAVVDPASAPSGERLHVELESGFVREQRLITGPTLRTAAELRAELVKTETLQPSDGAPLAVEDFKRSLTEIAADQRIGWVEAAYFALSFIFGRIYGGIEVDGMGGVRKALRGMPLVILPSHKSHLDYLLLSYVFYLNGLTPPHIAAGVNLNFWPMGVFFRHTGAFFIRRSSRQDPAYGRALRAYVQRLMKDGHTLEFFIEGGRSRTGKLLRPRYGLLGHVVDAVVMGHVHDAALCPTAIGYELIVEGQSYAKELSGGSKEAENVGQLVNAAMVLRERFGRVHVSFAEPLSLRALLLARGINPGDGWRSADERRDVLRRVGYRVLGGINGAAHVTASSVVAFALLSTTARGLTVEAIERRVGALIDYLLRRDVSLASGLLTPLSVHRLRLSRLAPLPGDGRGATLQALAGESERARAFGSMLSATVGEVLTLFAERHHVTRERFGAGNDDEVITATPERRVFLDYYKNTVVHALAREAILAVALVSRDQADALNRDQVEEEARFLSGLLRNEFVFEDRFDAAFPPLLDSFVGAGLVRTHDDGRFDLPGGVHLALRVLSSAILPIIEGYLITARGLLLVGPIPEAHAEFSKRLQSLGRRLWHTGQVAHAESISSVVFDTALGWLEEEGFARTESRPAGRRQVKLWGVGRRGPDGLVALIGRLSDATRAARL